MIETCVFLNNNGEQLSPCHHHPHLLFIAAFLFFKIQKIIFINIGFVFIYLIAWGEGT